MTLPSFEVLLPETVDQALSLLANYGNAAKIIAGGTDLVPSLKQRLFEPAYLIDIKPISELYGIQDTPDGGLRIGALTTVAEIAQSKFLHNHFPVLQQAAATVAGPGLRNVGTLGGNICLDTRCYWYNQSFFWRKSCGFCIKKDGVMCHVAPGSKKCWAVYSGDTAAALLTLDARLRFRATNGDRILPISEFFINDGQIRNRLLPGEILTDVLIPAESRGLKGVYEKFRIRGSVDYPLAGMALALRKERAVISDLRIALTAVNPLPLLLPNPSAWISTYKEDMIEGLQKLAARTAKPLKTSASTMEYRRHMIGVMIKTALIKLL